MGSLLAQQSNRTNIGKLQKICLGSAGKSNLKRYGQGRKKWGRTSILAFAKHIGVIHKIVGPIIQSLSYRVHWILKPESSKLKAPAYAKAPAGRPAYANLLRQGYGGQEASAGKQSQKQSSHF